MLQLFLPRPTPTQGSIRPTKERELQTRAASTYETLLNYFNTSSFRLPNNHLLVQIVKNLEYSLETPFEQVVEKVYARAPYVANHFNLTSQLSYGKAHKNTFYSSPQNSVFDFVFSNSIVDVDPFNEDRSWTELAPVKVIHHPFSDPSAILSLGEWKTKMEGYSVVHIDIPLLALQYREFCLEKIRNFESDAIYNANKFVVTRVLPKMLPSHLNYAIFNCFRVKQGLMDPIDRRDWFPIALVDNTKLADEICNETWRRLFKKHRTYISALQCYPLMFGKDPLKAFELPVVVQTRQLNWLQLLSRLPMIESLIQLQGRQGLQVNRGYISELKTYISYFMSSKDYNNIPDKELREKVIESLSKISHY